MTLQGASMQTSDECEAACCQEVTCRAFTFIAEPPAPFMSCQPGAGPCCYLKNGDDIVATPSTLPGASWASRRA
jgi:hypothetical protein